MINEILLSNIRELCKRKQITIANLEKKLNIGAGTISKWNKANPSLDRIISIAAFFEVSIDDLVGYRVAERNKTEMDLQTIQIIDYLTEMTLEVEESQSFWQDYKQEKKLELLVSELHGMNSDMNKLIYASDELGYYLLEIVYFLNDCYDYETRIRLYLVPDENTVPILQCDDKCTLQPLFLAAIKNLEKQKLYNTSKEKADQQRERIIKKYKGM